MFDLHGHSFCRTVLSNPFRITNETIVSASKREYVSDMGKLDVREVGEPLRVNWKGLWHDTL